MPSDDPGVRKALDALARPIAEFRSAISGALSHAEAVLAEATADADTRVGWARAELGCFAEGRVDPQRFDRVAAPVPPAEPGARSALARAVEILRSASDRGPSLFLADVPSGGKSGELATIVGAALAEVGRARSAVMLAELVRGGCYRAEEHDRLLDAVGFPDWNRAQRGCTPPLVITVDGADLHAAALADFCDGRAKLVLVVRGRCAPAALVRLITPGTLVLQTGDGAGLERVASFEGPAVAAIVRDGAARFLHDPAGGREPWQRLSVLALPDPPRHGLGGVSAWQLTEDLRQLASLAQTPFAIPTEGRNAGASALGGPEAVERLAAWLLSRSESTGH